MWLTVQWHCHPSIRIFREWLQKRNKHRFLSLSLAFVFHFSPGTSHYTRGNEWISLRLWGKEGESTRSVRRSDVTDVIFFPSSKAGPTVGKGGRGENNLKAELNFSSSESFVRALGGGQWLNGDVSRKVDSRERPALYRPSIHPLFPLHPPARERERAVLYRREKIYTRREKEK